jgi:hypothetical protein
MRMQRGRTFPGGMPLAKQSRTRHLRPMDNRITFAESEELPGVSQREAMRALRETRVPGGEGFRSCGDDERNRDGDHSAL